MPGPLELCRIIVEFDIAQLGENQTSRLHWGTKTSRKNIAKQFARVAWIKAGCPRVGEKHWPVTVDLIVRRGRRLDDGNAWGAAKIPMDVLFNGAIVPRDSPKYLKTGRVIPIVGKMWKGREQAEFVVYSAKTVV